jgi:surface antigen
MQSLISKAKLGLLGVISLTMVGCASTGGPNEEAGMIIGGVIGGILGSQVGDGRGKTAATIVGAMAGMAIGGSVGRSMDDVDRMKLAAAMETTRTGVVTEWRNPDTGYQYAVKPTQTVETTEGPCREFTLDAQIGGRSEEIYGTACRKADGSWRIVN